MKKEIASKDYVMPISFIKLFLFLSLSERNSFKRLRFAIFFQSVVATGKNFRYTNTAYRITNYWLLFDINITYPIKHQLSKILQMFLQKAYVYLSSDYVYFKYRNLLLNISNYVSHVNYGAI